MRTDTLRRAATVLARLGGLGVNGAVQARDGPWLVRAHAVHLASDNGGSTSPDLDLSVNDKWIPEVDVSYFRTPSFALELILTAPQKHALNSGDTAIATLRHLPPTLTAQYHVTGLGAFKLYVGAGLNDSRFSQVDWKPAVAGLDPSIDRNSWGLAVQAGLDDDPGHGLSLNLDPWLLGVGYRF